MNDQSAYWKPKFYMTAFIVVSALVLVSTHTIGSGEWVAINSLVLTTYVAGSVVENKLLKS